MDRALLINLDSIQHNISTMKKATKTNIMVVVKANAYGHARNAEGVAKVVEAAHAGGASYVGVAHLEEAIALHQAGCALPILAWLHTPVSPFEDAARLGIEIGVGSEEELDICASLSIAPTVHIKIDTGLGRNGIIREQWAEVFKKALAAQEAGKLKVKGLFSHFAVADEPERPETQQQIDEYEEALHIAQEVGLSFEVRHLASTAGSLAFPQARYDMVRIGLATYGLSPFTPKDQKLYDVDLKPAMTFVSTMSKIRPAPAGQGVSYGLRYVTDSATSLGLVPVGYADGIPRTAKDAEVAYKGKRYTVVGTIAMDQLVIDMHTEDIPDEAMDQVTIFGPDGSKNAPAVEELAAAAGTLNIEIVTRMGTRVPRIYFRGSPPGGNK
ncbi:MAG: alanine racemase [Micrococcaceae bacterium]